MVEPSLRALPLNLIRINADTQSRAAITWELVREYAEAWLEKADFPPLDVFQDKQGHYFLADGFHRLLAAKQVAKPTVLCRIFSGDQRDAFLFACTRNQSHGLRRTNSDKRYMVNRFLNDANWVNWTDARIAQQCGVSHTFVTTLRRELESVNHSPAARARNCPRQGSDGKCYPGDRKRTKARRETATTQQADKANTAEASRRQALETVRHMRRLLRALDLEHHHATALDAIEKDLGPS